MVNYGPTPIAPAPMIEVPFRYRNTSDKTIRINSLTPSCGCLSPKIESMVIAPGQSGRLVMPVNTINETAGPHEYLVKVQYTDDEPHDIDLALKVVLPPKEVIAPRALLFYQSGNQPTTQTVTITDYRPKAFKVKKISCNSEFFTVKQVSHTETISGFTELKLEVTLKGDGPTSNHRALLLVETDDPRYPILQTKLLCRSLTQPKSQPMAVVPNTETIVLQPTGNGQLAATRPMPAATGKASNILSISAAPEFVSATVDQDQSGQTIIRVSATLSDDQRTTRQSGLLTVRTKDSNQPVTIPVVIPAAK